MWGEDASYSIAEWSGVQRNLCENILLLLGWSPVQEGKSWRELGKLMLYGVMGIAYQPEQPVVDLRNEMSQGIMELCLEENQWAAPPSSPKKGKEGHSESHGKGTASPRPGISNVWSKWVTGTTRAQGAHRRHPTGCTQVCSGLRVPRTGWLLVSFMEIYGRLLAGGNVFLFNTWTESKQQNTSSH